MFDERNCDPVTFPYLLFHFRMEVDVLLQASSKFTDLRGVEEDEEI